MDELVVSFSHDEREPPGRDGFDTSVFFRSQIPSAVRCVNACGSIHYLLLLEQHIVTDMCYWMQ